MSYNHPSLSFFTLYIIGYYIYEKHEVVETQEKNIITLAIYIKTKYEERRFKSLFTKYHKNFFKEDLKKMMEIKVGKNVVDGDLIGYTPGSQEFEFELTGNVKLNISALTNLEEKVFNNLRIAMDHITLEKLKNSIVDFNKGQIILK